MGFISQQLFRMSTWLKQRPQLTQDKLFIDSNETVEESLSTGERRMHVRFPVELAVRYGESSPIIFDDFILNASKGGVYILTDNPLPQGSIILMHFFIPPDEKLLGEFKGEVIDVNESPRYPNGMHIKFFDYSDADMDRLAAYMEERLPVLDTTA